jgi:GGDEF domain-containing protein
MSVRPAESISNGRATTTSLSAAMRRLAGVADRASDPDQVARATAHELMALTGAEEVVLHHLHDGAAMPANEGESELVVVYLFEGDGRLSYLSPRSERPAAINWVASTGRSFLARSERELAASLPQRIASVDAVRSALLVPLMGRGEVEAVIVLASQAEEPFGKVICEQAATLTEQAATAIALVQARLEAGTDAVTGCMNHRAMRRQLQEEVSRAARAGSKLSCMLIDLDDFKRVNDRHGHAAGDAVLRGVAQMLMGEFRAFDRVARYGGRSEQRDGRR